MARKQLGTAPTADEHVATKKYVDDAVAAGGGGGGVGVTINDLTAIDIQTISPTDVSPVVDISVDATRKMTHIDEAAVHAAWMSGLSIMMAKRIFVP